MGNSTAALRKNQKHLGKGELKMKKKIVSVISISILFLYALSPDNFVYAKKRGHSGKKGTLRILTVDTGKKRVKAPIYVNGKKKGKGQVVLKLAPKNYKVTFGKLPGYSLISPQKGWIKAKVKPGKKKVLKGIYKRISNSGGTGGNGNIGKEGDTTKNDGTGGTTGGNNSGETGGGSGGAACGKNYVISDLQSCLQPVNSGFLEYYCFDGAGGYY